MTSDESLIINADDFGMAENVNRAVLRCFQEGLCTSTTIMPNMPGFEAACGVAIENGFHRHVGMHLVLSEGFPLTSEIRRQGIFCAEDGAFRLSRERPIFRLGSPEQFALAAEIRAQIRKCREYGIPISHVDSHNHAHTEWGIAKVLIPIVRGEGIPFVRIARNLIKNREVPKRIYKYLYNQALRRARLRATDYFGSFDEYLDFLDRRGRTRSIIEIMLHPRYMGSELYLADSIEAASFRESVWPLLEPCKRISFRDLSPESGR